MIYSTSFSELVYDAEDYLETDAIDSNIQENAKQLEESHAGDESTDRSDGNQSEESCPGEENTNQSDAKQSVESGGSEERIDQSDAKPKSSIGESSAENRIETRVQINLFNNQLFQDSEVWSMFDI